MCENLEEIYLLEFYVDVVKFRDAYDGRSSVGNNPLNIGPDDLGETIVKFKYFGTNHVEIHEEDFCPSTKPIKDNKKKVTLKSGKSCMFSLKSLNNLPTGSFDVVVSVYRKILNPEVFQNDEENWEDVTDDGEVNEEEGLFVEKEKPELKTEFFIGKTDVSLYESFKYMKKEFSSMESLVREDSDTTNGYQDTVDRSYKNGSAVVECHSYLRDERGTVMGEIVYLVRASCFGRTILTQFQLSEEEAKSHLYKRTDHDVCANREGQGDGGRENGEQLKIPKPSETSGHHRPSFECEDGTGGKKLGKPIPQEPSKRPSVECDFGGTSGKNSKKQPTELPKHKKPPIECGFGLDENGDMDLKALCECVCKCVMSTVEKNNNLQGSPILKTDQRGSISDTVSPGSVGLVGNQMILRMPDKPDKLPIESKFTSSVYYTQNGEEVGENVGQVVNVRPEYPHMISKDDPNAKQDVLILKLGRKRIAAGKKPRIEIEMRTPKFKDEKPVMEAKETQYLASDIPKTPKKPKSAKSSKKGGRPGSAKSGKGGKKKKK